MTRNDTRENVAANAVAIHLTGLVDAAMTVRRWDDGSAAGMHDFYIEGGTHKIALEVTTLADGKRVGRDVRWSEQTNDGWVEVPGLSGCWTAYHEGDAEAADVIGTIRSHARRLEGLGRDRFDTRSWQPYAFAHASARPSEYESMRALHAVGVLEVGRIADASHDLLSVHGGQVQIARGFGVSRPADRDFPVALVQAELREPSLHLSDVEKLAKVADATARHLWMWVETTEGLAMIRSFQVEGLPAADLVGEGIDGLWLGRGPAPELVAGYVWLRESGWGEFSSPRLETVDP